MLQSLRLVQLPFPSQAHPNPELEHYYGYYREEYQKVFGHYEIKAGELWEAPLWIAHLDSTLGIDDTALLDLSQVAYDEESCYEILSCQMRPGVMFGFSPLAQNLDLCAGVSRRLRKIGAMTMIGGNVTELAREEDFTLVYHGLANVDTLDELDQAITCGRQSLFKPIKLGRTQKKQEYKIRYRLLEGYKDRVPLVRLNASHGCLFRCTFCGDAWSKQLHVVPLEMLQSEIEEINTYFPNAQLMYIGDKTFGQSREAVANLKQLTSAFADRTLIVQTHVAMVNAALIDDLKALNVKVVEIGFESADDAVLQATHKVATGAQARQAIQRLHDNGFLVILNVLGCLPYETEHSHQETIGFLHETRDRIWLYNLYGFVPYPKTPIFPQIKARIHNWDYHNWREDMPPVFTPHYVSAERLWHLFLEKIRLCAAIVGSRHDHRSIRD